MKDRKSATRCNGFKCHTCGSRSSKFVQTKSRATRKHVPTAKRIEHFQHTPLCKKRAQHYFVTEWHHFLWCNQRWKRGGHRRLDTLIINSHRTNRYCVSSSDTRKWLEEQKRLWKTVLYKSLSVTLNVNINPPSLILKTSFCNQLHALPVFLYFIINILKADQFILIVSKIWRPENAYHFLFLTLFHSYFLTPLAFSTSFIYSSPNSSSTEILFKYSCHPIHSIHALMDK